MNLKASKSGPSSPLPIPVTRALRKLGQDLRDARRRRRIPAAILAERASISRTTLHKIEQGDAGPSIGNYAAVLFSLGLVDRISDLADAAHDAAGRELEEERLPERVRLPLPRRPRNSANRGDRGRPGG